MNEVHNQEVSATNDINASPKFSLDDCYPIEDIDAEPNGSAQSVIRKAGSDEVFVRVGKPKRVACLIQRHTDGNGWFNGESFNPVTADLQKTVRNKLRYVDFHPCRSIDGGFFMFYQKLQFSNTIINSWNSSLADALKTPCGQWMRVWSNGDLKRYEFESLDINTDVAIEYPEFENDLAKALKENVINRHDHPLIQSNITVS